jgi:alkanesulfonate monooxygenase SsuD/methylene tetrahydromethanopterin reductase-like flavin-dependent oxidoreductase (luciferase family)
MVLFQKPQSVQRIQQVWLLAGGVLGMAEEVGRETWWWMVLPWAKAKMYAIDVRLIVFIF